MRLTEKQYAMLVAANGCSHQPGEDEVIVETWL
jgi:hypothetical protein